MLQLSEHFTALHQSVTFTPLQGNCYNTGEGKVDLDVTAFETRFVNEDAVWPDSHMLKYTSRFYILLIFLFAGEESLLLKILIYDWNDRKIVFDLKTVCMNCIVVKMFQP